MHKSGFGCESESFSQAAPLKPFRGPHTFNLALYWSIGLCGLTCHLDLIHVGFHYMTNSLLCSLNIIDCFGAVGRA